MIYVVSVTGEAVGVLKVDTRNTNPRFRGHVGVKCNVNFLKLVSAVTPRQNVDFWRLTFSKTVLQSFTFG